MEICLSTNFSWLKMLKCFDRSLRNPFFPQNQFSDFHQIDIHILYSIDTSFQNATIQQYQKILVTIAEAVQVCTFYLKQKFSNPFKKIFQTNALFFTKLTYHILDWQHLFYTIIKRHQDKILVITAEIVQVNFF